MASGVSFPADARGVRRTTGPAKSVWAAAALGLGNEEGAALAAELLAEKDWRHGYAKYAVRLAELQSVAPPARGVAQQPWAALTVRSCRNNQSDPFPTARL